MRVRGILLGFLIGAATMLATQRSNSGKQEVMSARATVQNVVREVEEQRGAPTKHTAKDIHAAIRLLKKAQSEGADVSGAVEMLQVAEMSAPAIAKIKKLSQDVEVLLESGPSYNPFEDLLQGKAVKRVKEITKKYGHIADKLKDIHGYIKALHKVCGEESELWWDFVYLCKKVETRMRGTTHGYETMGSFFESRYALLRQNFSGKDGERYYRKMMEKKGVSKTQLLAQFDRVHGLLTKVYDKIIADIEALLVYN